MKMPDKPLEKQAVEVTIHKLQLIEIPTCKDKMKWKLYSHTFLKMLITKTFAKDMIILFCSQAADGRGDQEAVHHPPRATESSLQVPDKMPKSPRARRPPRPSAAWSARSGPLAQLKECTGGRM